MCEWKGLLIAQCDFYQGLSEAYFGGIQRTAKGVEEDMKPHCAGKSLFGIHSNFGASEIDPEKHGGWDKMK